MLHYITFLGLFIACLILPPGRILPSRTQRLANLRRSRFFWNWRLVLCLVVIGLVSGARGIEFGTDYAGYYEFYDYIYQRGEIWVFGLIGNEALWLYINLWMGVAGVPPAIFFGCVTAASYIIFIAGSWRFQSLLPLMFFFVISTGLLYWHWSGLRQTIAIMIFFYAIRFIIVGQPLKYAACIIAASLFHLSSLALLLAYASRFVPFYRLPALIIYSVSFLFLGAFDLTNVSNSLEAIFDKVTPLTPYIRLTEAERFQLARETQGANLGFWLKSAFSVWAIHQSEKVIRLWPEFKDYYILFLVYAVVSTMFFSVELIDRFLHYFLVCMPIVSAAAIKVSTGRTERNISRIFMFAFLLLFCVTTFRFIENSMNRILL